MEFEKSMRLLNMYQSLINGIGINKKSMADEYGVSLRSIQRDIEDLRCFFENQTPPSEIIYDSEKKVYRLVKQDTLCFSNSETLAVCKILLESRSMRKDEMMPILDKFISCCVPAENRRAVAEIIANEKYHYIEPHHKTPILKGLWDIGQAIYRKQVMEIEYARIKSPNLVKRVIEPVGIMFSEYYFYLAAFLRNINKEESFENADDIFPTIYRIDRIKSFKVLDEYFTVPYKNRFQEGEFRKRVQFMYGGRLQKIKFKYVGPSVEAVLDRLPTAKILSQDDNGWIIEAEIFGKGIDMWLKSQGENICLL